MSSDNSDQPSFFSNPALDHAAAGIGGGIAATFCMQPLDLIKVRFQVSTSTKRASGNFASAIWDAWRDILRKDGWKGMWRGITPNVVGNAASWGGYFWLYTSLKEDMLRRQRGEKLSAGQHLLAASEAGGITAVLTNPLWVVKTRMFTTSRSEATAYRGLIHGLREITRTEGPRGLWRGTLLALCGVANGALQFMSYEELKQWRFDARRRAAERAGRTWDADSEKLPNWEYTVLSGTSKLFALSVTYPYQVVRSRIQNAATTPLYPNIRTCVRKTYADEGLRAFYRGLGINALRVLPGTCVTFVVYENLAWLLRQAALKKEGQGRHRPKLGLGGRGKEVSGEAA